MDDSPRLVLANLTAGRNPDRQIAIELTDDSLSDIGLGRGSIVIVEIDPTPYVDRLIALVTSEGIIVRYLCQQGDYYLLCPKNPNYPVEQSALIQVLGYVHTYPEHVKLPDFEPIVERKTTSQGFGFTYWRNRPPTLSERARVRPS